MWHSMGNALALPKGPRYRGRYSSCIVQYDSCHLRSTDIGSCACLSISVKLVFVINHSSHLRYSGIGGPSTVLTPGSGHAGQ
jgi:hypothetical protein